MKRKSPHRGLELRLEVLRHRIRTLTEKMSRAEGIQKIENLADIGRLERRYGELEQRLDELNREDPGFRHEIKNEFVKLSSDLSGSLGDFIMRTDSRQYRDRLMSRKLEITAGESNGSNTKLVCGRRLGVSKERCLACR